MLNNSFLCESIQVFPAHGRSLDCAEISAFLETARPSALIGRKPLLEADMRGTPCVIRWFHHGGVLRNILKQRYIEHPPRAVRELRVLTHMLEKNLPVVQPVFALVESGRIGYRQALVTERLLDASDLLAVRDLSRERLKALLETLEAFFNAGLFHRDLNIKNILLHEPSDRFYLLDFDRAVTVPGPLAPAERKRMYSRLFRSFDKQGKLNVWRDFPFETVEEHVKNGLTDYLKIRKLRAFFWKLNKK